MSGFLWDESTAVRDTCFGKVRGYCQDGLMIFKGIPYAKAKRFHAPEKPDAWEGVFDASSYGYVCPLLSNDRPDGELYVPHRYWPMDEDCQNLNIWTPEGAADLPVLVWLHGGGYEAGSAIEQAAYDGANMSRLGNVVVVSINHRLNILGYFDLSDFGEEYENSGNAGGDDIIAALGWIRDNIASFGGDPKRVTVFGQSGGGAKVTTLLQSPAADGLYAAGINMSGVIGPLLADQEGSGRELAEAMMRELGVPKEDIRDGRAGVRALEEADFALLAKAYRRVRPKLEAEGKYVGGKPHPNRHYLGDPAVHGFRAQTRDVPLMVGSVFGEFTSFGPIPYDAAKMSDEEQAQLIRKAIGDGADELIGLFKEAYPERPAADLLRLDFIFRAPEIDYIAKRSAGNECTYSYLFNMDQPIAGRNTPWHCCDIPYVFHNIDLVEYPHGPLKDRDLPRKIERQVFECVMAFARTGKPDNALIPAWRASRPGEEYTLIIDADTRVRKNFDHELQEAMVRTAGPDYDRIMERLMENVQH